MHMHSRHRRKELLHDFSNFSSFYMKTSFVGAFRCFLLTLVLSHPFSAVIHQCLQMLLSLGLKKKKKIHWILIPMHTWTPMSENQILNIPGKKKKLQHWKGFSLCSRLLSASRYLFHVLNIKYCTIQPKWTFAQGWNTPFRLESPLYV